MGQSEGHIKSLVQRSERSITRFNSYPGSGVLPLDDLRSGGEEKNESPRVLDDRGSHDSTYLI